MTAHEASALYQQAIMGRAVCSCHIFSSWHRGRHTSAARIRGGVQWVHCLHPPFGANIAHSIQRLSLLCNSYEIVHPVQMHGMTSLVLICAFVSHNEMACAAPKCSHTIHMQKYQLQQLHSMVIACLHCIAAVWNNVNQAGDPLISWEMVAQDHQIALLLLCTGAVYGCV